MSVWPAYYPPDLSIALRSSERRVTLSSPRQQILNSDPSRVSFVVAGDPSNTIGLTTTNETPNGQEFINVGAGGNVSVREFNMEFYGTLIQQEWFAIDYAAAGGFIIVIETVWGVNDPSVSIDTLVRVLKALRRR